MSPTASPITPEQTLADLAVSRASASRVFYRHKLDFCCHGRIALGVAACQRGIDLAELIRELEAEEARGDATNQSERPLPELIEHVLTHYHAPHREELARLQVHARKVEAVHADKPLAPIGLGLHLAAMTEALEDHMQKEEQVLFPMILSGRGRMASMPVQVLELEHEDHARSLARMRELAHDFVAPNDACGTWRALYLGLAALERDLMEHIHLENNVIFPRALRA
ncbi:MAG TPA: iron-sulfur cluster repair di-iron protein [Planctomycetota bacterium]|nr:iron-sulfur cluster repair di-iron protein [Planctomycetota bacterium]